MNSVNSNGLHTAAVSFKDFSALENQLQSIQKSLPKRLKMSRFSDTPHHSGAVNYWRAVPAPSTKFRANALDVRHARLIFYTEAPKSQSLFSKAFDILCNCELSDCEEIFLSFCTDCSYEILRTVAAGYLTLLPYVTLPKAPDRPRNEVYVPVACKSLGDFEEPIDFTVDYVEGGSRDTSINSGASLVSALSQSPVVKVKNRPADWKSIRQIIRTAFEGTPAVEEDIAFELAFTCPVERLDERMAVLADQLGEIFDRTYVIRGFEAGYDPLIGLRDAAIPEGSPSRFPILHTTFFTSKLDIEMQIDGLLDCRGVYGLELQSTDRRRFEKFKEATGLNWTDGTGQFGRLQTLPDVTR